MLPAFWTTFARIRGRSGAFADSPTWEGAYLYSVLRRWRWFCPVESGNEGEIVKKILTLAACLLFIVPALSAQKPVTNDTIIKMTKAGLTDDIIINTISTMEVTYDVSPDALITLRENGVSLQVIAALQNSFIRARYGSAAVAAKPVPVEADAQTASVPVKAPAVAAAPTPASAAGPAPVVAQVTASVPAQHNIKPNVFFSAPGAPEGVVSSLRDQALVMAKNFDSVCSNASGIDDVKSADYRVILKRGDGGWGHPADTLMEVRDRNDNAIVPAAKFEVGPTSVKRACDAITSDWSAKYIPAAVNAAPAQAGNK